MNPFSDIPEALGRIASFMLEHGTTVPEAAKAKVVEAASQPSPVDRIVQFGKALYEHRESAPDVAKIIAAEALEFAGRNGWHGLDSEGAALIADLVGVA